METNQANSKFKANTGDHLANERTFLAWIRTSIGIIGLGFVVVKFSLFVRQISAVMGHENVMPSTGYSPVIGISLAVLGTLVTLFAYSRYANTKKMIEVGQYYHSTLLVKILAGAIFAIGLILIAYLVRSI